MASSTRAWQQPPPKCCQSKKYLHRPLAVSATTAAAFAAATAILHVLTTLWQGGHGCSEKQQAHNDERAQHQKQPGKERLQSKGECKWY
eukprot:1148854-Pelagomonas_calceolata.AAC.2